MTECTKSKFASRKFAEDEQKRRSKTSNKDASLCSVYLCPHCGFWHITKFSFEKKEIVELKNEIESLKKDVMHEQNRRIVEVRQEREKRIKLQQSIEGTSRERKAQKHTISMLENHVRYLKELIANIVQQPESDTSQKQV